MTPAPASQPPSKYLLPSVLPATLSVSRAFGRGVVFQYHSRSDHHSKLSCLLMMLDLMLASPLLRSDVSDGRVACGINHRMTDHASYRKKNFDLVLHRPSALYGEMERTTFKELLETYGVVFTAEQHAIVADLPDVPTRKVPANAVYVAFEAKAAMTAFGKARPRLYDELNSSHLTIHGDTVNAVAAALVMINLAPRFVSPVINKGGGGDAAEVTTHRQPDDALGIVRKVSELPRRTGVGGSGFDGVGVVLVSCVNDGSSVQLVRESDLRGAIAPADLALVSNFDYDRMIERVAALYEGLPHRR